MIHDCCRKWKVNLGDIQSDEERDTLLVINLPSADSSTTTILKSSIKYFCLIDSTYKSFEAEMSVSRSGMFR
jgi:predicted secreted Zn-dependent protease